MRSQSTRGTLKTRTTHVVVSISLLLVVAAGLRLPMTLAEVLRKETM
jgi:hypothetical protein